MLLNDCVVASQAKAGGDAAPRARMFGLGRAVKVAIAAGILVGLAACGAPRPPGTYLLDDLDNDKVLPDADWDALRSQLPPVPKASDTLPVAPLSVDRARNFTFGVDPRSVQIAPGKIVRYSIYSRSDRGAENISYESIRCGTSEWRAVATLRQGAGWERPYDEDWHAIQRGSVQQTLYAGVLCSGGGPAGGKSADLVVRLRDWEKYADALFTDTMR